MNPVVFNGMLVSVPEDLDEACMDSPPFWIDVIADRWEAGGVDSGNIWEISFQLGEDLEPGAVIETTNVPGKRPRNPTDIKRVLVLRHDSQLGLVEEEMPGMRPLVVANFMKIYAEML